MTTVTADRGASAEPVDPITVMVIGGALKSIAIDMGYRLARMSYSSIIRESEDFGCAICDSEGRQLCEATQSTPLQSGPIAGYLAGIERRFAELGDKWKPGDVVVHNHPYYGSSHQPDVGFCVPVFLGDELIGFSVTTAHHLDLGALSPGSCGIVDATNAYAEGILLNAVRVEEDGEPVESAWRIIADNTRIPHMVLGDMEAQVAAAKLGAVRFAEVVEEYGLDAVRVASDHILDHSERMLRNQIEKLPDGRYEAEGMIDGFLDHPDPAYRNMVIKAAVTISGSRPARGPRRHLAAGRPADQHAVHRHGGRGGLHDPALAAARHRAPRRRVHELGAVPADHHHGAARVARQPVASRRRRSRASVPATSWPTR